MSCPAPRVLATAWSFAVVLLLPRPGAALRQVQAVPAGTALSTHPPRPAPHAPQRVRLCRAPLRHPGGGRQAPVSRGSGPRSGASCSPVASCGVHAPPACRAKQLTKSCWLSHKRPSNGPNSPFCTACCLLHYLSLPSPFPTPPCMHASHTIGAPCCVRASSVSGLLCPTIRAGGPTLYATSLSNQLPELRSRV